ncbi:methionyl-tRNA formyltransferase [Parafrankia sp. EAN1pec]|uniref:Methionyl-tRNA formyltransferase n=1 Tax=Parafrankia sp. (strain EAN1pec) TaxID=298653 RepID=FMT_PARS2|nr:RecName: Full=Methionyl-tRNA formyltransferase [Frankia sp. EAN1pec]ABW11157.1 methionyl-tRNA formyltransferase [Frankia sp. EAN1pec]
MRLVFAGTPAVALPSLRALLDSPRHQVVAVVTRPDRPAGRGRHQRSSPVRELADERGLEVLAPARASDPDFLARLGEIAPDCCPVVAYGALLPRPALDIPKHGWVNLHFSLLPAYRGAAPVQRAVLAGEDMTGASVFEIEPALDSGPVYGVLTERIRPTDTSGDLLDRLAVAGARLLEAVMDGIEDGTLQARPQPSDGVSLAPKLTVEDVRVDWSAPAAAVDRLVRAATPAPGAWTTFRDRRVKLGPVRPAPAGHPPLPSGRLAAPERGLVLVGTATTPVVLDEVRPEGKAPMPAADWIRGLRPGTDEAFA